MSETPILYTADDCDESPRVQAWLTECGVAFVERDVTADADAASALHRTGTFGTPLLVFAARVVLGFRSDEITAALAETGVPAP